MIIIIIVNHLISKCSKLAQKEYKTRHNWVSKVIHWELYKQFKQTNGIRTTQDLSLENETHKPLWDFEIQTDHLISARRPELLILNKNREVAE